MRIAQIIDELRASGGAERLQRILAEALHDEAVEITVLTLHDSDPESVRELEELGVHVVSFPSSRFASWRRALDLMSYLRAGSFDVIHTHLVRATILGCLAGRLTGIPTVVTLHNTRRRVGMSKVLVAFETWVLRWMTDRVVAVGWETGRAHEHRVGPREIEIIPNAVGEPPTFSAADRAALRAELGVDPDAPLAIAVGRLHLQKGFSDLLRAFERVRVARPDARLLIAGRGRLREKIEEQIAASGLEEHVRLLGLRRDVPLLLSAADVYVSSAHWEGMPVATLEAMASGLPIVATRVGDVERLVEPGMGTLVEPKDPEAIAEALLPYFADPALCRRHGDAARVHVRRHFGHDAWAAKLLSVYRDLMPPGPRRDALEPEEHRCAS